MVHVVIIIAIIKIILIMGIAPRYYHYDYYSTATTSEVRLVSWPSAGAPTLQGP